MNLSITKGERLRYTLFLMAVAIFLYAFLFVPPFVPIGFLSAVDGLIYAVDGKRMCAGEILYRDFFQFSTPGTSFLYSVVIRIFGLRLWIPNLMLLIVGLGLAWVGVVIAKRLVRPSLALLPSSLFLAGIYKNELDPTHQWLSLLAAAISISVLMERRTPARIVAAGAFAGLAMNCTQSRGLSVVAGLGAFLAWEAWCKRESWHALFKKEAYLAASFITTVIAGNAYFAWKAGLARFLWCTAVFAVRYYPKDIHNNTLRLLTEHTAYVPGMWASAPGTVFCWFLTYACLPLTYILFFVRYWRDRLSHPTDYWARPMLLAIVGFLMFLSVALAPSETRVAACSLPGTILLIWFADALPRLGRTLSAALVGMVVLGALFAVVASQSSYRVLFPTVNSNIAIPDGQDYEEYKWIQEHTQPGEYLEGAQTEAYFNLDIRNPSPLIFLTENGYVTTEQAADIIQSLRQRQVRYVFWRSPGLNTLSPGHTSEEHLGPLRSYVRTHYRMVKSFANSDEIWQWKN